MKTTLSLAALLLAAATPALRGQVSIVNGSATDAYQVSLSGTYVQDFDSLPNTAGSWDWDSDVTIPGWYGDWFAGISTNNATYNSIGLGNYGTIGAADRALGMIGATYFGLRLANATDLTITGLDVSFDGEQWVRSPNIPQVTDTLTFQYQIFDAGTGGLFTSSGWTTVEELAFTSPNASDTSYASFIDGNAAENRIADISHYISGLVIEPGQEVWLRWMGVSSPDNNHGLAIDNLRVSFTAIPEPAVVAALLGGLALILAIKRRQLD